jgi:Uma2 family endonuclease
VASAWPKPWTVGDFLTWEREQAERFELVDGMIRMMTGGSNAHAAVKGNLFAALRNRLEAPCRAFVDGPKVVTATASLYPDVLVTCAPVVMSDDTVREPALIAEVLSRTTAEHDRGAKCPSGCPGERILRQASDVHGAYRPVGLHEAIPCSPASAGSARPASPSSSALTLTTLGQQLPGLAHYLLVWQDVRRVELFSRRAGGWELVILEPPAAIELPALAVELEFDELYDGVLARS